MDGVAAVLTAAGESTRMGRPKALLPWGGPSLLAHQVHALADAAYSPIIVVLGHDADRLRPEVPPLPPVTVTVNPHYREGRSTSVVRGLQEVPAEAAGVLVISVDQPRPANLLRRLREAFEAARPPMAVPAYHGGAGHPPLFSTALLPELLAITEERQGLREVVARHRQRRLLVEVDTPLALSNINTEADYEEALRLAEGP